MIQKCSVCHTEYEDVYRDTFCPHAAFLVNDGQNNFAVHLDSFVAPRNITIKLTREEVKRILSDFDISRDVEAPLLVGSKYVEQIKEWHKELRQGIMEKLHVHNHPRR